MENQESFPHISVNAQYIKDLSFESPGVPASLALKSAPKIDLSLDLHATRLSAENTFEVELYVNAKAIADEKEVFIVELKYAGVFTITNVPEEQIQAILGIHCPATIFPFARKIIADVTQDGGFQPLMLDPIDFGVLYYKKLSETKN